MSATHDPSDPDYDPDYEPVEQDYPDEDMTHALCTDGNCERCT